MKRHPIPEGWPSPSATRMVCRPGVSSCKVPAPFFARCFSMMEHWFFSSAFFRQALPPCLTLTHFLHKQQIVLLLSFSGFGRNSNRLPHLSLLSLFSSAHVDSHSPWLPAVFVPCSPSPPWAQTSLRPWEGPLRQHLHTVRFCTAGSCYKRLTSDGQAVSACLCDRHGSDVI